MKKIIFYSGRLCSGKSTIAKEYAKLNNLVFVEASDIVRDLLELIDASREAMQGKPELGPMIAAQIYNMLADAEYGLVVSGVRQVEIITMLEALDAVEFEYNWIEVDKEERLKRYLSRARKEDVNALTEAAFNKAEERDEKLGLEELKQYFYAKHNRFSKQS